LETMQDRR